MDGASALYVLIMVSTAGLLVHDGNETTRAIAAVLVVVTGVPVALANGGESRA